MKFSIAIPAYKPQYLEEAIMSVLSQSYDNWELIVVDDCSPYNLKVVLKSFNDTRIKYYRNDKNFGAINVVENWNRCLEYVSGDYVICMGDDDRLLPNCIEEYKKLIEKYPGLNVYHGLTEIIDENSCFLDYQAPRPEYESALSLMYNRFENRRHQYIGDFLYKVVPLKENGGFFKLPLAWGSDDISAIIAASGAGIANTQVPVFQYRVNRHTISSSVNSEYKLLALKEERIWYHKFLNNYTPDGDIEKKYYLLLSEKIDFFLYEKLYMTIALIIRKRTLDIFKILKLKSYLSISNKCLLKGIILGLNPIH